MLRLYSYKESHQSPRPQDPQTTAEPCAPNLEGNESTFQHQEIIPYQTASSPMFSPHQDSSPLTQPSQTLALQIPSYRFAPARVFWSMHDSKDIEISRLQHARPLMNPRDLRRGITVEKILYPPMIRLLGVNCVIAV